MNKFWPALFLLHVALRFTTLTTTFLDVDESQFAGFAHVLMDGGLPYRDSLDTKPLGIYLFYQFAFTLFGKYSMFGVHLLTLLWQFSGAAFLYGIFHQLKSARTGRWAAFFYVVFSTTFIPKYLATSINAVMTPLLILSAYFWVRSAAHNRTFCEILSALILGIAFLFKYQAGIQSAAFCLATLPFFKANPVASRNLTHWFLRNARFGFFFILPFVIHSLTLHRLGVWDDFVEWSFKGSSRYISGGSETISFGWSFLTRFLPYVLSTLPLWFFAGIKIKNDLQRGSLLHNFNPLFLSWFVLTLIPVSIGGRFYSHYFLQLLPSLCALAAISWESLQSETSSPRRQQKMLMGSSLLLALFFLLLRIDMTTTLRYFPDDELIEQKMVGKEIQSLSSPDDRIFVWGFATAIYFYAERKPASRFLWTDWQTGRVPGPKNARLSGGQSNVLVSDRAWSDLWEDLNKTPPAYFIDTASADFHGYGAYPINRYPEMSEYLKNHYEKIKAVAGADIYRAKRKR